MIEFENRERWMVDGACTSIGVEAFYPDRGESWREPKNVCLFTCPVLSECQDWVMRSELGMGIDRRFGIIGGMTPNGRKQYESTWLRGQQLDVGDVA